MTAVLIGVAFLGARPAWSQWPGPAVVVASVPALGLGERGRAPVVTAGTSATSAAP